MKIKFESEEKLVSAAETQIGRTYRSNGTGFHYLRIEAPAKHLSELAKTWFPFLELDEMSPELSFFDGNFELVELPQESTIII